MRGRGNEGKKEGGREGGTKGELLVMGTTKTEVGNQFRSGGKEGRKDCRLYT